MFRTRPPATTSPPVTALSGEMWTWELRWPFGRVTIVDRCWRGEARTAGPKPVEVLPRLVRPPGPFYDLETAVVFSR